MLKRLLLLICLLPTLVWAENFEAGKDYLVLGDMKAQSKPSLIEFFSYGCPWCYRLEPELTKWLKSKKDSPIQFTRVPVIFHKDWIYYSKAYYAAHLLGLSEQFDALLFKAVQTDKLPLNNNQAMIEFFTEHGVDKATAESAFDHSTTVDMNVNKSSQLMVQYKINGVPAFIVNHHYKTDLQMAGSIERLIKLLDYLLSKKDA